MELQKYGQSVCINNISNITNNFSLSVNALVLCDCENVQKFIKHELISWEIPHRLHWLYALTMMVALAIVFTNVPIVVGIIRDKQMHRMHNIFIAGQAFSDLSLGFILAVNFTGATISKKIPGGYIGCNIVGFWIPLSCHSTVFSLALIAHGRYKAIIKNEKYSTGQCLKLIGLVAWLPSFTLTAIYTGVSEATLSCSGYYCNPIWNKYLMPICGFFLICPTIYIFWAYRKIHIRVLKTSKAVDQVSSLSNQRKVERQQAQNHMTKLMVIMCLSIFLAWTPIYIYFLVRIIDLAKGVPEQSKEHFLLEYGVGLGATLSSLVSPILYVFLTDNLRLAMLYAPFPLEWKRLRTEKENRIKREVARPENEKEPTAMALSPTKVNAKNTKENGIIKSLGVGVPLANLDISSTESNTSNENEKNDIVRFGVMESGKRAMSEWRDRISKRFISFRSTTLSMQSAATAATGTTATTSTNQSKTNKT